MTYSIIQDQVNTTNLTPTLTISPASSVTAGHGLTFLIDVNLAGGLTSITSSNGDVWTRLGQAISAPAGINPLTSEIWYCKSSAGGTPTITVTGSGTSDTTKWELTEWSGSFGSAGNVATGHAQTTSWSLSSVTAATGDLTLFTMANNDGSMTGAPPSGFLSFAGTTGDLSAYITFGYLNTAATTTASGTTGGTDGWSAVIGVLSPTASSISTTGHTSNTGKASVKVNTTGSIRLTGTARTSTGNPSLEPVLLASYVMDSNGANTASLVSPSFTPTSGELLVLKFIATANTVSLKTPTATGGSIVWASETADVAAGSNTHPGVAIYAGVVTAGGLPITVSLGINGTTGMQRTAVLERWTNAVLATTPAVIKTVSSSDGTPSTTITTAADSSVVTWLAADQNSVDGSARAYSSSAVEDAYKRVAGSYTGYWAYQNALSAGSQTLGLTTPSGQKWTILGLEIKSAGESLSDGASGLSTARSNHWVPVVDFYFPVASQWV